MQKALHNKKQKNVVEMILPQMKLLAAIARP